MIDNIQQTPLESIFNTPIFPNCRRDFFSVQRETGDKISGFLRRVPFSFGGGDNLSDCVQLCPASKDVFQLGSSVDAPVWNTGCDF